jgi:hypothetical protein
MDAMNQCNLILMPSAVQGYLGLMRECWAQEPSARPSFDSVAQWLGAILSLRIIEVSCRWRDSDSKAHGMLWGTS